MRLLLLAGVALSALIGFGYLLIGSGPTAQISGWVLMLIAAVLLVGVGVIGSVERLRRTVAGQPEPASQDRHRYPG